MFRARTAGGIIRAPAVQLDFPFRRRTPSQRHGQLLVAGSKTFVLRLVRNRRARRYILRVDEAGVAKVTIPRAGSMQEARAFVRRNLAWLERQRYLRLKEESRSRRAWQDGSTILLRGDQVVLTVMRAPEGTFVRFATEMLRVPDGAVDLRPHVESYLRRIAVDRLVPRLRELALRHDLTLGRVTIRNARTRWGSCSSRGTIALSWRLIQMPDPVSDYVLLHELMHLREPNHSPRFWRLVEQVCPHHRDARAWLNDHGRFLV
jgi:predicted metal-dependent hydrolase